MKFSFQIKKPQRRQKQQEVPQDVVPVQAKPVPDEPQEPYNSDMELSDIEAKILIDNSKKISFRILDKTNIVKKKRSLSNSSIASVDDFGRVKRRTSSPSKEKTDPRNYLLNEPEYSRHDPYYYDERYNRFDDRFNRPDDPRYLDYWYDGYDPRSTHDERITNGHMRADPRWHLDRREKEANVHVPPKDFYDTTVHVKFIDYIPIPTRDPAYTQQVLTKYFSFAGPVSHVKLIPHKSYCFVSYTTYEAAQESVRTLDSTVIKFDCDVVVKVTLARPPDSWERKSGVEMYEWIDAVMEDEAGEIGVVGVGVHAPLPNVNNSKDDGELEEGELE